MRSLLLYSDISTHKFCIQIPDFYGTHCMNIFINFSFRKMTISFYLCNPLLLTKKSKKFWVCCNLLFTGFRLGWAVDTNIVAPDPADSPLEDRHIKLRQVSSWRCCAEGWKLWLGSQLLIILYKILFLSFLYWVLRKYFCYLWIIFKIILGSRVYSNFLGNTFFKMLYFFRPPKPNFLKEWNLRDHFILKLMAHCSNKINFKRLFIKFFCLMQTKSVLLIFKVSSILGNSLHTLL